MRPRPLSSRELVLFWSHCRRVGHDQRAWLLREQVMLLTAVSGLTVKQMTSLRVRDVHVQRRGVSWFEVDGREFPLREPYMRARMMSWYRHCLIYGYEWWLMTPRTSRPMDRRPVSRLIRRGVKLLFGSERLHTFKLERMRKECSNSGYRNEVESALATMLSYVEVSGNSCGVWEDEIESALRSDSLRRRAFELGVTSESCMNVSRIRSRLRKLGLLGMVDSRRDEFESYLRIRDPDASDDWCMNKFYEWVCEELLGDGYTKRVDGVDVGSGSGSRADGVHSGEGAGISSDAGS